MQVTKEEIKRPKLFEPFFDKELTPQNEFVTYIDCTNRSTNAKKDSATPVADNSEKSLKNENHNRHADKPLSFGSCIVFDKWNINHPVFHYAKDITTRELEIVSFGSADIEDSYKYVQDYNSFSIIPQPHNN